MKLYNSEKYLLQTTATTAATTITTTTIVYSSSFRSWLIQLTFMKVLWVRKVPNAEQNKGKGGIIIIIIMESYTEYNEKN